mmetsp:Transcript_30983/g.28178  ORF Transcript_30983/g.28178 Transcript_30983/m.28178 type:complete len:405 (-) Transcript_30983:390-1604(-)
MPLQQHLTRRQIICSTVMVVMMMMVATLFLDINFDVGTAKVEVLLNFNSLVVMMMTMMVMMTTTFFNVNFDRGSTKSTKVLLNLNFLVVMMMVMMMVSTFLDGDSFLGADVSTHIHVDVHAHIVAAHIDADSWDGDLILGREGQVTLVHNLGSPVLGLGRLLSVEVGADDTEFNVDIGASSAAAVHISSNIEEILRGDVLAGSGGIDGVVAALVTHNVVFHIALLDDPKITLLEGRQVQGGEVSVTSTTGLDTFKLSGGDSEASVEAVSADLKVKLLCKREGDVGTVDLRLAVIQEEANLGNLTGSVAISFESGLEEIGSLAGAAGGKIRSLFARDLLDGALNGFSDNESLLLLELRLTQKGGLEETFKIVRDIGKIFMSLLEEGGGEVGGEDELEGEDKLSRH